MHIAVDNKGIEPGVTAIPLSINLGSRFVTHKPTRSPCSAVRTDL